MASDLQEKLRAHCGAPEHWGKVDIKVGQVRECRCDEYREAAALALEDAADLLYRKSYTSHPWSLKEASELVRARAEEVRNARTEAE